ncbi:hypothetical protein Tco_0812737 [Tanacetum coccineum]
MNWEEVNSTHAYYNGSRTSKDNEDPSWSISFKTRRTQKTSSALEDFICVVFVPDRNITIMEKVDTSTTLDASLVDIESSGTELKELDTSSRSGNDAHADDADI